MTSWPSYVLWFTEHYDELIPDILKDGAVECNGGPTLRPLDPNYPSSAPWRAEWAVTFADGKYFRVKECFKRATRPNLGLGVREHFSFHYGEAHPDLDEKGFPKTQPRDNPPVADLRIDIDKDLRPHIHVGSRDHIYQPKVRGYSIGDADLFKFLVAVRDHRNTGQPLVDLLKIEIVK